MAFRKLRRRHGRANVFKKAFGTASTMQQLIPCIHEQFEIVTG